MIVHRETNGTAKQFIAALVVHRLQGIAQQLVNDGIGIARTVRGTKTFGGCGRGDQRTQTVGGFLGTVLRGERTEILLGGARKEQAAGQCR